MKTTVPFTSTFNVGVYRLSYMLSTVENILRIVAKFFVLILSKFKRIKLSSISPKIIRKLMVFWGSLVEWKKMLLLLKAIFGSNSLEVKIKTFQTKNNEWEWFFYFLNVFSYSSCSIFVSAILSSEETVQSFLGFAGK